MSLNYFKVKHKNSTLELLQKYEKMFDGTLGKYIVSDYTKVKHENILLKISKKYEKNV